MSFLRKYNTLLVTGTTSIRIPIIKRAVVDYAVGADWTPVAGDVKVFVDGAAVANITNLPTAIAAGNTAFWEFILTAAELTCKQLLVTISDAATKVIEDQAFIVETYGNASAMYAADLSLANLPANVTQLLGTAWLTPGVAGTPDVNAKLLGGTAQTGRDIGASVLLSAGAGAGQLDFTAGVVKASLAQILGTAILGTAAQIAAAFTKFFDKAAPTGTINSLPDAVAGAAGGLFIAGANAATSITTALTANVTGDITGNLSGTVGSVTGAVGSVSGSVGSVVADVGITQAAADKVWASATRTLTAFSTALALSVWDVLTANILTASSIGIKLKNWALGTDNRALVSADVHTSGETVAAVTGTVGSVAGNVGGNVVGSVGSVTGAVGSVTADVGISQAAADKVFGAAGAGLPELAQGIPSATPSPRSAMMLLYMALRNLVQVTATEKRITNDAGTVIAKKALADDSVTYSESEMVSGP
jgi:hypothetical protein